MLTLNQIFESLSYKNSPDIGLTTQNLRVNIDHVCVLGHAGDEIGDTDVDIPPRQRLDDEFNEEGFTGSSGTGDKHTPTVPHHHVRPLLPQSRLRRSLAFRTP